MMRRLAQILLASLCVLPTTIVVASRKDGRRLADESSDNNKRYQPFLVLTTQRSGSTYFMSMLRSIQRNGGPLRTVISEPVGQLLRGKSFEEVTNLNFDEFRGILRMAFGKFDCDLEEEGARQLSCGFKLMYNQIPGSRNEPTELSRQSMRWLVDNNVKIVHLIRKSHVRKILSVFRLAKTGVAHTRTTTQDGKESSQATYDPLTVEVGRVVGAVRESVRVAVAHRLDLRKQVPEEFLHEVLYEQFLEDSSRESLDTFRKVLGFLSPGHSAGDLREWTDKASSDILSNPFMPCSNLVADNAWPTIQAQLSALLTDSNTKLHEDPEHDAEMRADLDFALQDCTKASYNATPNARSWASLFGF